MADKKGLGVVGWTLVALGGLAVLGFMTLVAVCAGGAFWSVGNGEQYDATAVLHDDCENAFVSLVDEPSEELQMLLEAVVEEVATATGNRSDDTEMDGDLIPRQVVACGAGDGGVVVVNMSSFSNLIGWSVGLVLNSEDAPSGEYRGATWWEPTAAGRFVRLDGTLILAMGVGVEPTVDALLDGGQASSLRDRLVDAASTADLVILDGEGPHGASLSLARATSDDTLQIEVEADTKEALLAACANATEFLSELRVVCPDPSKTSGTIEVSGVRAAARAWAEENAQ